MLMFFRLLLTAMSIGSLINMFQQLSLPFSPRTIVRSDGTRIRQGTLDNVLDSTASVWGFCMFAGLAFWLWII